MSNRRMLASAKLLGATALVSVLPLVATGQGFVLSLDGEAVTEDRQITDAIRRTDVALERSKVQITVDGIKPEPRLDLETVGQARVYRAGDTVELQSRTNYPSYIERSEMRIIDRRSAGGPRLVSVVPIDANGRATTVVPDGEDIVVVHRVYDKRGRFDETGALPLSRPDDRGLISSFEEGSDFTARRKIPVNGGAVTVTAQNVPAGSAVYTMGEVLRPSPNGGVVVQRILRPGEYDIQVQVKGAGSNTDLTRAVEVPGSEWFYVAIADLTYYRGEERNTGRKYDETTGRLAYYVDGETQSGVQVTSSLDTGEQDIDDIFRRLDERDPAAVLYRLDRLDTYPTFGDDSSIEDNTPTSGRFYLRLERDENFLLWGDYTARIAGSAYLRNERNLYGAQAGYASQEQTERGDARGRVEAYVSSPEELSGRDVFRGTGGSVYFLQRQDIGPGTENLTVEIRDADSGRVVDRQVLVAGRDYEINYLQGIITLNRPLSDRTGGNLVLTNPGGDNLVNLVAQYEYTPTGGSVDGLSYGARAEAWVTDDFRVGLTGLRETTGTADQDAYGVDLRYEFGENTFVQLDYARSEGPGFDAAFSNTGGLVFDTIAAAGGSGSAVKVEGQADLQDLGYSIKGVVGGYFEDREQGFTTLDYQTSAVTGDERFYGAFVRTKPDQGLGYNLYFDQYENGAGTDRTKVGIEVNGAITDQLSFDLGVQHLDEVTSTTNGTRTDVAGRLEYAANSTLTYALIGQGTLSSSGLKDYNRLGVGFEKSFSNNWSVLGELTGGTGGVGGRFLATYEDDNNASRYFGYELDPGRAIDAGISSNDNGGKFILGGREKISESVTVFGENIYDIFGQQRSLTSAYGIEYTRSKFLSYDASFKLGQVEDTVNGDFRSDALSLGVRYHDDQLTARARFEYRRDRGENGTVNRDGDTIALIANAEYKIDKAQRMIFSFKGIDTDTDNSSILSGRVIDASVGYAFRPIQDERLNVLARYRFYEDTYGQQINGVAGSGPVQKSHVFSIEGNYDLDENWTLGAKVGGRITESAATAGDVYESNDAYLNVVNVRYHFLHKWDGMLELRSLKTENAGTESGALVAAYRHIGKNTKIGVGYNWTNFSDDLVDLTADDKGLFINLVAKF